MARKGQLVVGLDPITRERLEALARSTNRSKSFLAGLAIATFLEMQEWQLQEIRSGLSRLHSGDGVSDEEVRAWLESWGTRHEKPPPKCK